MKDKKALLSKQNIYLTIKKLFLVDIEESIKKGRNSKIVLPNR